MNVEFSTKNAASLCHLQDYGYIKYVILAKQVMLHANVRKENSLSLYIIMFILSFNCRK